MKKILLSILLVLALTLVSSCSKKTIKDGTITEIVVELKDGGTGYTWLEEAGARFSELKKDYSYADGKLGVKVTVVPSENPSLASAETSGTCIYDLWNVTNLESFANTGKIVCIDEMMRDKSDTRLNESISIDDKIDEVNKSKYQVNGKYYGAPTCEYYPSLSYDVNLFDRYGYYLANEENGRSFDSTILDETYYFIEIGDDSNKSCGPDGEFNTSDDGLPSSLSELIALCEFMKSEDVSPLSFTGQYRYYSNFLPTALMIALQGYERSLSMTNFNGEAEIVIGESDEPLYPGCTYINKPITKKVNLSEENGYLTTWGVEKYYALAFEEIAYSEGWFGRCTTTQKSQLDSIQNFIFSDFSSKYEKIGIHIDGSYWYNEGKIHDYFKQYENMSQLTGFEERKLAYMSLPVNISEAVTEGNGKGQTMTDMAYGMFVINGNLKDNPELLNASLDFIKFLESDKELSIYSASTSIKRSLNYEVSTTDKKEMEYYGNELFSLLNKESTHVIYLSGNNETFKNNPETFVLGWTNAYFSFGSQSQSYYDARERRYTSDMYTAFKKQAISKEVWKGMYHGANASTFDSLTEEYPESLN